MVFGLPCFKDKTCPIGTGLIIVAAFMNPSGVTDDILSKLANKQPVNIGSSMSSALNGDFYHYRVGDFFFLFFSTIRIVRYCVLVEMLLLKK